MGFYREGHKKHVGDDGFFPTVSELQHPPTGFCFYITEAFFLKKNACKKAEKVREERDDDLNKLLQFFR